MKLNFFKRIGPLSHLVYWGWRLDAKNKINRIEKYLDSARSIVDVGSGFCIVTQLLQSKGYRVSPCDINDYSITEENPQLILNGRLPFKDNSVDTCLLLTVLHHIDNPEETLKECKRVSNQLIIIEDVYSNVVQKRLTHFFDSLFNWEFLGHPHSNKSHAEWLGLFKQFNLEVCAYSSERFLFFFRQNVYVLKKRG